MALNSCRLTLKGKEARNILLDLVYPNQIYSESQLSQFIGVSRDTIRKILDSTDGGVQLAKLVTFFKKLLKEVSENDLDTCLKSYNLKNFYRQIEIHDNLTSFLPRDFYTCGVNSIPISRLHISENKSDCVDRNTLTDLVQLFWYLDYKPQENQFETALESSSRSLAFSIVAPCDTTQRWLLNRLLRQVIAFDPNNIRPLTINLDSSGVRNNFQEFIYHLSRHFKTTADIKQILNEICRIECNSTIVIIVNQFRRFKQGQKDIIIDFWQPLCKMMSEQQRAGRIIMFWVDERYPCQSSANIVDLEEFTEISQADVEKWTNRYSSDIRYKNCVFSDDLLNHNFTNRTWNWSDPELILDNICREFKLNGIADIKNLWSWNYDKRTN